MNNETPAPQDPFTQQPQQQYQQQNPYPQQQGYAQPPQWTPEQQAQMQTMKDGEHLNLLSVFHYVIAGLNALGFLGLLAHYVMMKRVMEMALMTAPAGASGSSGPPPAHVMATMMDGLMIFYLVVGILILAAVITNIVAGRCLKARKGRVFCMVISVLNCLSIPLGTVLGIFTMIVLCRNSVVQLYHDTGMGRARF